MIPITIETMLLSNLTSNRWWRRKKQKHAYFSTPLFALEVDDEELLQRWRLLFCCSVYSDTTGGRLFSLQVLIHVFFLSESDAMCSTRLFHFECFKGQLHKVLTWFPLLCFEVHVHIMAREFTSVVLTAVYVPPQANAKLAMEVLQCSINKQLTVHPDSVIIVAGDFNHANL